MSKMNFKTIEKYTNFESYQRIKKLKDEQKDRKLSKSNIKKCDYMERLNKLDGLKCCDKTPSTGCCDYSLTGEGISAAATKSQIYTTLNSTCICYKGIMNVSKKNKVIIAAAGTIYDSSYSIGPFGAISPLENPSTPTIMVTGYNNLSLVVTEPSGTDLSSLNYKPMGSLSNKTTCEGTTIEGICFYGKPDGTSTEKRKLSITFSGDMWGGSSFKCLILSKGKQKYKFLFGDLAVYDSASGTAADQATNPVYWNKPQIGWVDISGNPNMFPKINTGKYKTFYWGAPGFVLTEGEWTVQIGL
jgi:hypothetical protein